MRATKLTWLVAFAAVACASGGSGASAQEPAPSPQKAADATGLVPAGFGTLKQDAFTVSIRSGTLLVKVTPLAESVIRLAAPDTYTRLHALAESRRESAQKAALGGDPQLFLVSLFSYQPDVPFQPEDVQLVQQGRILRSAAILPMSSGWGKQRLDQQETQAAVYVFDGPIDYGQPFIVRNGLDQSDGWSDIIPVLDAERAKVQSRSSGN